MCGYSCPCAYVLVDVLFVCGHRIDLRDRTQTNGFDFFPPGSPQKHKHKGDLKIKEEDDEEEEGEQEEKLN